LLKSTYLQKQYSKLGQHVDVLEVFTVRQFYMLHIFSVQGRNSTNVREKNIKYSTIVCIWINWDGEPSRYAENPDNWTFL